MSIFVIVATLFACSPDIPLTPQEQLKMRWTHPPTGSPHHYVLEIQFENMNPTKVDSNVENTPYYGYTKFTKPDHRFRLRAIAVAENGLQGLPSEWSDWVV